MYSLFRRPRPVARSARPVRTRILLTREDLEERTLPSLSYSPVDFSAFHNARFHDFTPTCANLPAGDVSLGGVPFSIPTVGTDAWWGQLAPGPNPHILDIPVGVAGVEEVHTLINTTYGQYGPTSWAAVEFYGSGGAFYRKDLIGNEDIRDFLFTFWTNYINNTTTTNVGLSGAGLFVECRMDKQRIDLPDRFLSETLTRVRVIDWGGPWIQNLIVSGITVGARTPDLVATSLAFNTTQGGVDFAYQVARADLAQESTASLYWATGPTLADRVGGPVFTTTVARGVGSYGPVHVPAETLDAVPNASHLLLVLDPDNAVVESDEQNNLQTLLVPQADVALLDATTLDFRTIELRYAVANWAAPPFEFQAYLSADAEFDPGVDEPLGGRLAVSDFELRRANPDGSARSYPLPGTAAITLTLDARAPVSDGRRFVLVVADPDHAVEPLGAASRANNATYVVPLLGLGERLNRVGDKGVVADHSEETDAAKGSGPFTGAVLRGTGDFRRLQSLEAHWVGDTPGPPFEFGLQTEALSWQRDEDKLVQESLLSPVDALTELLLRERGGVPDAWGDASFSIDEAYDSTRAHGLRSLHYEGRALALAVNGAGAARFAGLAWLAGFDWVRVDDAAHVHVSERAAFVTTIDPNSLRQAVTEALTLGLIDRQPLAATLVQRLDGVEKMLALGNVAAARSLLQSFRITVQCQRSHVDAAFADLLLGNVDLLLGQLSQQLSQKSWRPGRP